MSACRARRARRWAAAERAGRLLYAPCLAVGVALSSAAAQEVPATADPESVSIGALEPVGGDAAGVLSADNGGFGPDLWHGSGGERLLELIRLAPVGARSPAMHDLMRRLFASAAKPDSDDLPEGAFVAARLAALVRLGAFEEAEQVAELAGETAGRPARAALHFWHGETEEACALIGTAVTGQPTREWQRALFLCQVRAGDTRAADLTLALLGDTAGEADAPYLRLAARLLDYVETAAPVLEDGPGFAASLAGDVPIGPEDTVDLGPAAALALARREDVAVATRLAAGERAAATGALPPGQLGDLYGIASDAGAPADAEETENAWPGDTAAARAGLFRAALAAADGRRSAELLARLWRPAAGSPGFLPLARAAVAQVVAITPNVAYADFAADATRASAAAGRAVSTAVWHRVLADAALEDAALATAWWQLEPLVALATAGRDSRAGWGAGAAVRWWNAMPAGIEPAERAARADRAFMVLDAVGQTIGADGWALFHDAPHDIAVTLPNIGLRYGMRDAVRAGRTGEAVLLALIVIGKGGPSAANPVVVGSVIRTMRALGLADDARAIAIEALIEHAS